MSTIEKKFAEARQEVVAQSPEMAVLELQRLKEVSQLREKEFSRLATQFTGAQEYISGLEHKNRELEQAIQEHKELAQKDGLTGLLNLRGFEEKAGTLYGAVAQGNSGLEKRLGMDIAFNVLFIDLNDFKPINDAY